jgi:ABC-type nitrate/sulfonate/bicarbonate transport system substrate-binding protein
MNKTVVLVLCGIWLFIVGAGVAAYKFLLVGQFRPPVTESPPPGEPLEVPFIFWGGDVATFLANGGVDTQKNSIFDKLGLKLHLVPGDKFDEQIQRYKEGKSPFLRGTLSMLGQKSAVINGDPQAPAVVFLQLSWSAGDHLVARKECKTLADLKGKKIALQRDGPHVGMLDDIRWTAGLSWEDIGIVWTENVSGPDGPAARFRNDPSVNACFVVSPDMTALIGGLEAVGTGNEASGEKTVPGAHVLVSTAQMSRSIADVYACRKDYFESRRELVEKFTAGYLKGCEELLALKEQYDQGSRPPGYLEVLGQARQIWKEWLASRDDAHGLISDCSFVGLAGNRSFFTDAGNPSGFKFRQDFALDLAVQFEEAQRKTAFLMPKPDLDYAGLKRLGDLSADPADPPAPPPADRKEGEAIFSFKINFGVNETDFSEAKYGEDFRRVIQQASLFGRAGIFIRGHADPTKPLLDVLHAGEELGVLRKEGASPNTRYFWKDQDLKFEDTDRVIKVIRDTDFGGAMEDPKEALRGCRRLSVERAEKVQKALLEYAKSKKLNLAADQIHAIGLGIQEPIYPVPRDEDQKNANRRVEFRISKVSAKAETSKFFPY